MALFHINFTTTFSFEADSEKEAIENVWKMLDVDNIAKIAQMTDPAIKFVGMNGIGINE
jgi:hypothetical protein